VVADDGELRMNGLGKRFLRMWGSARSGDGDVEKFYGRHRDIRKFFAFLVETL
jgi:hypothetical protein